MAEPISEMDTTISLVDDRLLDAIAQVESGNRPQAMGDQGLMNPAVGAFQMRRPAYNDVIQRRKDMAGIPFALVATDPALQREFARSYLQILEQDYGFNTLDTLLSGYNAGPSATRRGALPASTRIYIHRVKTLLGQ